MRLGIILLVFVLVLAGCWHSEEPIIIQGTQMPIERNVTQPAANTTLAEAPFEQVVYQPGDNTTPPVYNDTDETANLGFYERQPEAPPSIAKYKAIFAQQVKNYKFVHKNDQWFVAGKKAKMIPFRLIQRMYNAPYIDTIYFDLESRTAFGVCEGHDDKIKMQCIQQKVLGMPFAMPYLQYKIPLPEDWLTEYQNLYMAVADAPKLVTDRETVHLKHQSETKVINIYIDPDFGLPLAVVDGDAEYHYERLSSNSLGFGEKMTPE